MRHLPPLKGKLSYYSYILGIVVLLMFFLRMCSQPGGKYGDGPKKYGGDTLNIAIEFSPVGVYTTGDTLSGFYYELLEKLSAKHNLETHVTGFSRAEDILPYLENGTLDIVIADIALTTDIKSRFAYTQPLLTNRVVLVQKQDSTGDVRFHSQLDLIGQEVFLPAHSPFKARLQNLARELGGKIEIVEHPDYGAEQLLISVAIGESPNAVVNSRVAAILKRDYPMLDTSVELSLNQFQSWLFNATDTLLRDSINVWLDDFKASKDFKALSKKYF